MKNKIIIIAIALLSISLTSCKDWLEVEPLGQFSEERIFSTKEGFYSTVNGVYTGMGASNQYGAALSFEMVEILAKRYAVSPKNSTFSNMANYNYNEERVSKYIGSIWESMYKNILTCNIILKNLELKKDLLGVTEYSILKGEMLAARAFMHFDLLRLFGPIYSKSPDKPAIPYNNVAGDEIRQFSSSREIIENYVLKDLSEAEILLKEYDPVIKDGRLISKAESDIEAGISNAYRYRQLRFNYYAVLLTKARIQLYKGDTNAALITSKMLITDVDVEKHFPFIDPNMILGSSLDPDRMFSTECLFGVYNKARGDIYIANFDPASAVDNLLQPRAGFVKTTLFTTTDIGDYRLLSQWTTSTSSSNTGQVLVKHQAISTDSLFYASFTPLVRLSEAYLIAAECEPSYVDGLSHLNKIRFNRGAPNAIAASKAALDAAILSEYSREYYGEGQMFYYYKRRNINIPYTNNGQALANFAFADKEDISVLPIPVSESSPR